MNIEDDNNTAKDGDDKVQKITGILSKTTLDSGDRETVPLPVGKMNFFVNEVTILFTSKRDFLTFCKELFKIRI